MPFSKCTESPCMQVGLENQFESHPARRLILKSSMANQPAAPWPGRSAIRLGMSIRIPFGPEAGSLGAQGLGPKGLGSPTPPEGSPKEATSEAGWVMGAGDSGEGLARAMQ